MVTNILDYIENSEKRVPHKVVFAEEEKQVTYSELVDFGKRIGTTLLKATGNAKRKPIVVYVDRNLESLVSFVGVAYSGNFYVPIDKQMPKSRIELILQTLKPIATVVLASEVEFSRSIAPGLATIVYEEAIKNPVVAEDELARIRRFSVDTDPIYATFTSGSTGIPKGVITCQRSVVDMTEALVSTFNFDENIIVGNQNPFYFDASIKDIYCTLKCGGTMYIIPKSCFVFPAKLVDYLNKYQINLILWSAAAIALVANTGAFELEKPSSLKKVMFSGEVMHNKVLNYWRKTLPETMFVNLYGPTEITSVCSYFIADRPFGDDEPLPIGMPFKNTEILLLNEKNQPVTGDEIGEICVRGCCLALGYYNNPEKTAEAFCQNPLNDSYPEKIYRTGDLARYNSEGQIMFLSRKDNQVKHMGQRVELGEIELLINSLELIDASICFYDHDKQKIVLIFQGEDADNKYIINSIKDKFPKYMYPNIMIKLGEMPYNLNGKIDRTLLKNQYNNGELS
ncbi:MAG: amino acid adenylation domain-containing protein [Ignavibacteriales bacterium]|nr:MAG: amino acid adenylation domain-containing protein [Ignavibacteriales bacterium]